MCLVRRVGFELSLVELLGSSAPRLLGQSADSETGVHGLANKNVITLTCNEVKVIVNLSFLCLVQRSALVAAILSPLT